MSKFYNYTVEVNTETIFNNKPDETASGPLFGERTYQWRQIFLYN